MAKAKKAPGTKKPVVKAKKAPGETKPAVKQKHDQGEPVQAWQNDISIECEPDESEEID